MTNITPSTIEQPTVVHTEPVDAMPCDNAQPSTSTLENLLNTGNYRLKEERALIQCRTVEPALPPSQAVRSATDSAPGFSPPTAPAPKRRIRNGKIARLPKPERDMVNKLLQNNVPYSRIVWALAERRIHVTERNISNWRISGGYDEWRIEQENQIRLAQIQDHLLDYLRKNDAHQIPEVGLQVAATQLTCTLMNPETSRKLLEDPKQYKEVVGMLSQCSDQLTELDEKRREFIRKARIRETPENMRWEQQNDVDCIREIASAEEIAQSGEESNVPHRNALPPRDILPVGRPGPTMGELIGISKPRPSERHFHIQNALACGLDKPAPRKSCRPVSAPKALPNTAPAAADAAPASSSASSVAPAQILDLPPAPAEQASASAQSQIESDHSQTPVPEGLGSLRKVTEGLPVPNVSDQPTPGTELTA